MRGEKKWPGDLPDTRNTPDWGSFKGVWVCYKKPGRMNREGKKYPKDRGKAEKKFGCKACDKKLSIGGRETICEGPRFFDGWTVDAILERFGEGSIFEKEPPEEKVVVDEGSNSGGEKGSGSVQGKDEVVASGRVEDS